MITTNVPTRTSLVNADCSSTGKVFLNSTWGYAIGSKVILSATGQSSIECEVVDVQPTYIQLRKLPDELTRTAQTNYGLTDLSAYTLAAGTKVFQRAQLVLTIDAANIRPENRVTLEMLNAPWKKLGVITAAGAAKNNNDAGFWNTGPMLKELVVTVVPDNACYVRVFSDAVSTADTNSEPLAANEKRTFCLGPTQGWISVLPVGSGTVNLKVYRHNLE